MKRMGGVLCLISAGLLVSPALLGDQVDGCIVECMQRSGCWSGGSTTMPEYCHNRPELCGIECRAKFNTWGAIAFSWKEKASGWSYGQSNRAAAERVALQGCVKQGGARCIVQTSVQGLCGSVASDGDLVGWGTSGATPKAQQRALAECARLGGKRCAVQASICSSPESNAAAPAAPRPPRAVSWGAIAYSNRDMGAGWSQGKNDRASAEKEAMSACSQRGKACILRTTFNKQCGALAADRDISGWGTSADPRQAQRQAMDECRKAGGTRCVLHVFFCSQ